MIEIKKPVASDIAGISEVFYRAWLLTYPNEGAGITVGRYRGEVSAAEGAGISAEVRL